MTSDEKYFEGRTQKHQMIIQGKFKEEIKCTDALTGIEYNKPFKYPTPKLIENLVVKLARRISPSTEMKLNGIKPKVLMSLGESVQVISVDEDGEQPDILSVTSLKEKGFADSPDKRQKLFTSLFKKNQDDAPIVYDTNKVYTFEMYDDHMDYTSYKLNLSRLMPKIDMVNIMDNQPLHVMARRKSDGKYLWFFTFFHARHKTNE